MKKVKQLKGWHIYELNAKEQAEYGFTHAPIHPDMLPIYKPTPSDADWECDSLDAAISWITNYDDINSIGDYDAKIAYVKEIFLREATEFAANNDGFDAYEALDQAMSDTSLLEDIDRATVLSELNNIAEDMADSYIW